MSIEENSSGKTLDATLAALASNVRLPEGVTSGDKPLAETDSALGLASNVRLPEGVTSGDLLYAVTEAAPSAFEEAARAFIAEQQAPAKTAPALALVEKDAEAKALEELKPLKQFYMKQIEELISKAMDPDVILALREVLKEIGLAKDASSISAALANAPSAATAAMAKVETPEERVERLTAEIAKLDKEIGHILDPHMTKEERERRKELERQKAEAKTEEERQAIQKQLNQFDHEITERLKQGTAEERRAADEVQPKLEERDKKTEEKQEAQGYRRQLSNNAEKTDALSATEKMADTKAASAAAATVTLSGVTEPTQSSPSETGALSAPPQRVALAKAEVSTGLDLG